VRLVDQDGRIHSGTLESVENGTLMVRVRPRIRLRRDRLRAEGNSARCKSRLADRSLPRRFSSGPAAFRTQPGLGGAVSGARRGSRPPRRADSASRRRPTNRTATTKTRPQRGIGVALLRHVNQRRIRSRAEARRRPLPSAAGPEERAERTAIEDAPRTKRRADSPSFSPRRSAAGGPRSSFLFRC